MNEKNQIPRITSRLVLRLVAALSPLYSRFTLSLLLIVAVFTASLTPFTIAHGENSRTASRTPVKATLPVQGSETVTIYGPHQFDRTPGTPTTITEQFTVPTNVIAPFVVRMQNGSTDGAERVTTGEVLLNGAILLNQQDFSQQTLEFSRNVSLQQSNTLAVTLQSAVGSHITITVTGTHPVLPSVLQSVEPTYATQGQNITVTFHGQNTHWLAGQTQASLGAEVSVGGAAAGELGPVTVINSETASANVSISSTAALAPRTALLVTPNVEIPSPPSLAEERLVLENAFTVVATSPPSPSSSTIVTMAGLAGEPGFADGNGLEARFRDLSGLAIASDGLIYVADSGNHSIRVVYEEAGDTDVENDVPPWNVYTLAGDGSAGFADGPVASARFNNPKGVAIDASGAIIVADTDNHRIRRISTSGFNTIVTTLAGDGVPGFLDGPGNQARFNSPSAVAADDQGNVYVADTGNSAVRVISSTGEVSTLAGDGTIGSSNSPVARFDGLAGIATDGSSVFVYLGDTGNHRIRRLDQNGSTITIAGGGRGFADGAAAQARFAEPSGIVFEGAGNIIVADAVNSLIRSIDLLLAENGSNQAVVTLAGTGERGATDGPGNVAQFFTPRGVAVMDSSAVIIADTGNHTLRRLTLPPVISSFSPAGARPGESITINGARFDARGSDLNTVRFARTPESGGGQVVATVTSATAGELVVVVPDDAATGEVTVQTEGGTAVSPTPFNVLPPAPVITDFSPQSGAIGATVTLTGDWLKAASSEPAVTFAGRGNTRLPALVAFSSLTEVQVTVPNAAVTGRIELTNAGGQASTAQDFTVIASQDFQVTVAPASASAVQGTSATYVIKITSTHSTFTQLARLTLTGLPAGVEASFEPEQITAGATSTLTLNLANANLAAGAYLFGINAAAEIDGNETVRTVQANLSVITSGQTTLSGRVLSTENEPIIGATISLDGHSATTDAAGSFLLVGVNAGADRPVMIDGRTASAPNRTYPVLAEPATIVAGQANAIPYVFYLPAIDVENEVVIVPGQTTVVTTPRVPGLQLTVPAGANLRNRDNTPVTRVSITPVPIDRTPTPLPTNVTTAMVYTNQPGGAISDLPMPMVFPNLQGADPGTRADLYAFNHDTVQWYIYGYGRVSADGRLIVPEIDPATGQPYGLVDFSWYFPSVDEEGNPGERCPCPSNRTDDPVDLSTGMKIESMTDVSFGGVRGGIDLTRVFTSDLNAFGVVSPVIGRFGRGSKDNYDITLTGTFGLGGAGRLVLPEERTGRLFSYTRTDPDGALVFTSTSLISHLGSVVRQLTDGTFEYRASSGQKLLFDSSRRLVAKVDRNGNATTLSYTGSRLTTVTDPVGRSITMEYNAAGLVERVTDPLGRQWTYTYEFAAVGQHLTSVTDPLDNVVQYDYAEGPLVSITDGRGQVIKQISYGANGRVVQQTFADGGFERYSYQLSGTIVTGASITNSLNQTYTKRFNSSGYVIGMADELGQSMLISRDIVTNLPLATIGSCNCSMSIKQFDARGNVTSSTNRLGQTASWEHDPVFNNVTRAVDRMGRETIFGYDSRGNLTSVTDALNQTVNITYDGFGQVTAITDPLNHTITAEYDAAGNLTAVVDPLNNRTTFENDALGRLTAVIDPLGRRRSVTYNELGQVDTSTDSSNAVTLNTYDANGNLVSLTNALGQRWQWAYDAKNRIRSRTDPLNRTVLLTYNSKDELTEVKSALNRIIRYGYNARGQVSTITDPLNNTIRLGYDHLGNATTLTDQRGHTTTYTYDELGRPISRHNPLGQFLDVTYDAESNVSAATDQLGRRTTTLYDALHRRSQVNYPDATVNYSYDAGGRLTRIDDTQSGFVQWAYDNANRILSETTANGTVTYGYNGANQRLSMTASSAAAITYGYDTAGRLETITHGSEVFTHGYDTLSRLINLQRPNGVSTAYAYDNVGRLKRLTHTNAVNQALEDYRYTYTLEDQISSITSLVAGQLLPSSKNATTADAANRISQVGTASRTFDATGETTSKTDGQGVTTYQWDGRGRLRQASLPGGQTVDYGYDPLGRRTSRTVGGVTTNFLYDGLDVVRDTDTNGNTVDYINGQGIDNKLRQTSDATGELYFLHDHLGSTAGLTNASGVVVERPQYEAFGEGAGSAQTRYDYTGRERDELTGLLSNRARWYDPSQGRFMSEDPIGHEGGINLYAYVENNPLSSVDPLGFQGQTPGEILSNPTDLTGGLTYTSASAWWDGWNRGYYENAARQINTGDLLTDRLERVRLGDRVRSRLSPVGQSITDLEREARQITRPPLGLDLRPGSATRTNVSVNRFGRISKYGGAAGTVVSAIIAGYNIYHAPPCDTFEVAAEEVGGFAGALAVGWAGAKFFGGVGTAIGGPFGGIVVGTIGGIAGGIFGYSVGRRAASAITGGPRCR